MSENRFMVYARSVVFCLVVLARGSAVIIDLVLVVLVLVLHSVSLMCWAHGFSVLQCLAKVPPSYIYSHVTCSIAMVKPVFYASVKTKHSYNANGQYLVTSVVVFVCVWQLRLSATVA